MDSREASPPLDIGRELLAAHADELRHRVWDALPLIGLLAAAHDVDDALLADLKVLASSPDRKLLGLSRALLLSARSDVPAERRAMLHDRLGAYGLQLALDIADRGLDAAALAAELEAASGIAAVRRLIDSTLRDRSDALRTDALLTALERMALARRDGLSASAAAHLRGDIEALRTGPYGGELRALDGLRRAADRELPLSVSERGELRRLFAGADSAGPARPAPGRRAARRGRHAPPRRVAGRREPPPRAGGAAADWRTGTPGLRGQCSRR